MRSFQSYIEESNEGGAKAGKLEIGKTTLKVASEYAIKKFAKHGKSLYAEIPDHDENFTIAKYRASLGHTKRKDMPVILPKDMMFLQKLLKDGSIDINAPWSDNTGKNPFPKGLSGDDANNFFTNGLVINDGSVPDDKVNVKKVTVAVSKLVPIQQQIYYDKPIKHLAKYSVASSKKFHQSTLFLASADLRIIDGNHRWLSAMILDPKQSVQILMVELPFDKLLPLALAFGDARGNMRNA